ncbi:MAG: chloride channel protein, partial [Verrucomicrobiales bacterium]|nr:chloride channel protein [Verrucomicrobiales bacterium]
MRPLPKTVDTFYQATRAYIREHWRKLLKIRELLRFSEETIHLVIAGCVGVCGGFINILFYEAIAGIQFALTGERGHNIVEVAISLVRAHQWAWVIAIPTVGALLSGLVLYWGTRLAGKQGTSNMLEVVVAGDGRLPFRTAV